MRINTTAPSASEHAARYEALRHYVLDLHHTPAARDGLAVLLRQGVPTWMDAWSRLPATPAMRAAQDERQREPLPDGVRQEMVHVLAAMALEHIKERHA